MPSKPEKIKRVWKPESKPQSRVVDMSSFYNDTRWRRFSKEFKERNPLCSICAADGKTSPTKYTDHINRLRMGFGSDLNNLKEEDYQPLCDACHASKSGKEAHGYRQIKK